MGAIGDGRADDLGVERIGEEQELLALMRGNVGQDAAGALARIEPVGPRQVLQLVRTETDGVDDLADRARCDQSPAFTVERVSKCSE